MILTDLVSLLLRIGELAFSATVAGLTGEFLHKNRKAPASSHKRFIYTIVVAAISILFSVLFLLPFLASFSKWPMDFVLFVLWIIAFGLLTNYINGMGCGSIWQWGGLTQKNACARYKANIAFCFLAAIFFLASAIIGLWVMRRNRKRGAVVDSHHTSRSTAGRRKWYGGRSRV